MGSDDLHFKFGSFMTFLRMSGKAPTSVNFRDSASPGGHKDTLQCLAVS